MSRVKSSGSEIERTLGRALWAAGIRYRKQYKKAPGKPDFALISLRIAIFCDSSFWHGRNHPKSAAQFKSNRDFWLPKIQRNISRDEQVDSLLKDAGWVVLRFWDDRIMEDADGCVSVVLAAIKQRRLRLNELANPNSRR